MNLAALGPALCHKLIACRCISAPPETLLFADFSAAQGDGQAPKFHLLGNDGQPPPPDAWFRARRFDRHEVGNQTQVALKARLSARPIHVDYTAPTEHSGWQTDSDQVMAQWYMGINIDDQWLMRRYGPDPHVRTLEVTEIQDAITRAMGLQTQRPGAIPESRAEITLIYEVSYQPPPTGEYGLPIVSTVPVLLYRSDCAVNWPLLQALAKRDE